MENPVNYSVHQQNKKISIREKERKESSLYFVPKESDCILSFEIFKRGVFFKKKMFMSVYNEFMIVTKVNNFLYFP